jgi:hypothetical protein
MVTSQILTYMYNLEEIRRNTLCLQFTDFKHSKSTKHEKRAIHIIKLFRGCIVNNYPPCGQRLNLLSCADKAAEGPDISSQMCLKHALIIINPSHNIILTWMKCWGSRSGTAGSACFWASRIRIFESEVRIRLRILPFLIDVLSGLK